MRIWVDRNKINQLSAMLNSIELETGRLKKMVGEITQGQLEPTKPEAPTPKPEVTLTCSICLKQFLPSKRSFYQQRWVPKREVTEDMMTFGESESRFLIRLCSMPCIEAAERKRYTAGTFGGVETRMIGRNALK
jgi:hypothetical protein